MCRGEHAGRRKAGSIYARIICAGLVLIGGPAVFSGTALAQAAAGSRTGSLR